jgi:hypothetical protein
VVSYTTPRTAVALFNEYVKDYEAALNPCMLCMLEKCPEAEREKLDVLLEAHLDCDDFSRPPHSPVQMRRIQAKLQPLFDQAMSDPAVIAAEDQREAHWRDTPWWRKRYLRLRFKLFALKMRLRTVGRKPPWE